MTPFVDFVNPQLAAAFAGGTLPYPAPPLLIASDDLPPKPEEQPNRTRGPYGIVRVERDVNRKMGLVDTVYDCTLRCEIKADELTGGAISGAGKGDSALARVVSEIIDANVKVFKSLGLGGIIAEFGTDQTRAVRGASRENNKILRISFSYIRPFRG